jgi:hypothetical protein
MVVYDLWPLRQVHRTTVIGYALIAASILTLIPVASMSFWYPFVEWIRSS